ncbi:unnamed protein product [Protopolystoma xenopodis]|uniref:Uncharacterized protein n=1 Tax=Protopolystoma xenopodis TaxID=117903 RepID=A0A448WSJ4_9PLAT|nr:unnamed protein product [Protopolystoma xenopodis]
MACILKGLNLLCTTSEWSEGFTVHGGNRPSNSTTAKSGRSRPSVVSSTMASSQSGSDQLATDREIRQADADANSTQTSSLTAILVGLISAISMFACFSIVLGCVLHRVKKRHHRQSSHYHPHDAHLHSHLHTNASYQHPMSASDQNHHSHFHSQQHLLRNETGYDAGILRPVNGVTNSQVAESWALMNGTGVFSGNRGNDLCVGAGPEGYLTTPNGDRAAMSCCPSKSLSVQSEESESNHRLNMCYGGNSKICRLNGDHSNNSIGYRDAEYHQNLISMSHDSSPHHSSELKFN